MTLVKTSLLNGIAVLIKMLTLFAINKVLAVYVGPSGYAALGQFQNAMTMLTTFANGIVNTGVTKYTAEYKDDVEKQQALWGTAGTLALITVVLTSVIIFIFREKLALIFLHDASYNSLFTWLSVSLVFFVCNTFLLAILNGKKEVKLYVVSNIAGSLLALFATSAMTYYFGLYGALVALGTYQSFAFIVTFYICLRTHWFKAKYLLGRLNKVELYNLVRYSLMALTSAICVPLSQTLVRNYLGAKLGWDAAGYWEAMWRLSTAYLMLVTTTLSVYYLPRLSELRLRKDIVNEIVQGYKYILPVAAVGSFIIYILRDFLIKLLFSSDFAPMHELFGWQLLGDTFKISSWILAYVMLGKAMVKLFILTEIIFAGTFYGLVVIMTNYYGLQGVSMAHAVNYAIYFGVVAFFVIRGLPKQNHD
jgi:PST family polysaccharide transporter